MELDRAQGRRRGGRRASRRPRRRRRSSTSWPRSRRACSGRATPAPSPETAPARGRADQGRRRRRRRPRPRRRPPRRRRPRRRRPRPRRSGAPERQAAAEVTAGRENASTVAVLVDQPATGVADLVGGLVVAHEGQARLDVHHCELQFLHVGLLSSGPTAGERHQCNSQPVRSRACPRGGTDPDHRAGHGAARATRLTAVATKSSSRSATIWSSRSVRPASRKLAVGSDHAEAVGRRGEVPVRIGVGRERVGGVTAEEHREVDPTVADVDARDRRRTRRPSRRSR